MPCTKANDQIDNFATGQHRHAAMIEHADFDKRNCKTHWPTETIVIRQKEAVTNSQCGDDKVNQYNVPLLKIV